MKKEFWTTRFRVLGAARKRRRKMTPRVAASLGGELAMLLAARVEKGGPSSL